MLLTVSQTLVQTKEVVTKGFLIYDLIAYISWRIYGIM